MSVKPQASGPLASTLSDLLGQSKPVVSVGHTSSILQVTKKMLEERASTLFVEENGVVRGIIKEKDVIQHVFESSGNLSALVTDIMDSDIGYATPSLSIKDSMNLLNEYKQDHLPILDENFSGKEISVDDIKLLDINYLVSAKYVIGQFYYDVIGGSRDLSGEERLRLEHDAHDIFKFPTVKMLMQAKKEAAEQKGELGTIVLNTLVEDQITVSDIICQMTKFRKGSVAILDIIQDVPILVGIVTEQDVIRRAISAELDLGKTLATDIMSKKTENGKLATVNTKDTLLSCAYKMIDANVRHLPIVSPKGERIYGMISSKDVVSFLCKEP